MAEVQVQDKSEKGGKVRSKKQSTRVDMTPMVDLNFLMLMFFMFTTTFSKPNVMDLGLPAKPKKTHHPQRTEIDLTNSISLIIGKDNRIFYHQTDQAGLNENTLQETTYDKEGITKVIEQAKRRAKDVKKFTVIIKPTDDAVYKNFVDILDQMTITNSQQYGVTDIKPWEKVIYEKKVGGAKPAPAQ
jgi:biopolymer transport protein ExbD